MQIGQLVEMNFLKKVSVLLKSDEKFAAFSLLGLMLISMVLDTIGIGMVIPALSIFIEGKVDFLGFTWSAEGLSESSEKLATIGMLGFLCLYLVKSVFMTFFYWKQSKFIFAFQASLSRRLYSIYLHQPYPFHVRNNSASLINNVTLQVGHMVGIVQMLLVVIAEGLVIVGLSSLLILIDPIGALTAIGFLFSVIFLFHRTVRSVIHRTGQRHYFHEGKRLQHLQQGLGGVKEIKVLGCEGAFVEKYDYENKGAATAGRFQFTMQALPRVWLEFIFVSAVSIVVTALVFQGNSVNQIIPVLGFYTLAAFRLLPALNRALTAFQNAKFAFPAFSVISNDLIELKLQCHAAQDGDILFNEKLELKKIRFSYADKGLLVIDDLNLKIKKGEAIGVIGKSGVGKSTLIDILLGLQSPSSGDISIDSHSIVSSPRSLMQLVAFVPQQIHLTDDTLRHNVCLGVANDEIDNKKVVKVLEQAQLSQFVEELESEIGEHGVRLSGGQKQRIGIARALYQDRPILVLDEATSSLDEATESEFIKIIMELKSSKTIVMITHRHESLKFCDKVFELKNGKLNLIRPTKKNNF
ncbi:ABC transporter ATP-binding protein/permease [Candidatus Puniceispirillum sp.]|nr:ABC transporter ATP-binding protein/permease [Candidatus Puniceispirillum sp.]